MLELPGLVTSVNCGTWPVALFAGTLQTVGVVGLVVIGAIVLGLLIYVNKIKKQTLRRIIKYENFINCLWCRHATSNIAVAKVQEWLNQNKYTDVKIYQSKLADTK